MMATLVTVGLAVAQPSRAELEVRLDAPSGPVAPTPLVVTATVTSDAPVIEYAWAGLDVWPPCEGARCDVFVPLASCQRVALEVTNVLGEVAQDALQVCASDGLGRAPEAELELQTIGSGVRVRRTWSEGSAPVIDARLFVDAEEIEQDFAFIEAQGGCHAVELLVVDEAGRTGWDRRQICRSEDAPQVVLQADPRAIADQDTQQLCAKTRHPLGLAVTRSEGEVVPLDGCAAPRPTPSEEVRRILVVQDAVGLRSTASLWVARAPDRGPPTLPRAVPGSAYLGGEVLVAVVGGVPPFVVQATLEDEVGQFELTPRRVDARTVQVDLPQPPVLQGPYHLTLRVTDERGLSTRHRRPVAESAPPDAGISAPDGGPFDPGPTSPNGAVACTSASATGVGPWLLVVLLVARRWRSRCC